MHTNGFTMNKIPRTNEEDQCFVVNTYECVFTSLWEKKCFQFGLQFNFRVAMTICNSLYFYTHECNWTSCMNCKRCNSPYIFHPSATHCNSLQLYHNDYSFSTTMQFPCDYNHNVMLTSFLIHSSKFNTWHYDLFWVIFFEILISIVHYDYSF